jgi:hypothetical protein
METHPKSVELNDTCIVLSGLVMEFPHTPVRNPSQMMGLILFPSREDHCFLPT